MGNKTNPSNSGVVVMVRGSVVDIRFDEPLPPIYSLLHAREGEIAIEVLAQLDAHRVREALEAEPALCAGKEKQT